jgi:hypothetical protein
MARGIVNTLPFRLTLGLLIAMIQYCTFFSNATPQFSKGITISPTQRLTGVRIKAEHLKVGFADGIHFRTNADRTNTMQSRVIDGLALYPISPDGDKWKVLNLETSPWTELDRSVRTLIPMPLTVGKIDRINKVADTTRRKVDIARADWRRGNVIILDEFDGRLRAEEGVAEMFIPPQRSERQVNENAPLEAQVPEPIGNFRPVLADLAIPNPAQGYEAMYDEYAHSDVHPPPVPRLGHHDTGNYHLMDTRSKSRERHLIAVARMENFVGTSKLKRKISLKKGLLRPDGPESAKGELTKLLKYGAWKPKEFKDMTYQQRKNQLRSQLFMEVKRTGKLKSRLVGGGNKQDRSVYDYENDISSPTVTLQSVYHVAAIAASESRDVMTIDIESAYLHADVHEDIFMRLDPVVTRLLCQIDPKYEDYVQPDGSVSVKLEKALYGLLESARLFYEHLKGTLTNLGFTMNPYDCCVFNRTVDGVQQTLCFHVDDILITCADTAINDRLNSELEAVYPNLNAHRGDEHDYLGMILIFDRKARTCKVDMTKSVEKLLLAHPPPPPGSHGPPSSPAGDDLFKVDTESPLLDVAPKQDFHSCTAKCLYLSKRRPDISLPVAFLCTRVQHSTDEDLSKLNRLLSYLDAHRSFVLILDARHPHRVVAFVDSSYGIHMNKKSHTGVLIRIGRGAVFISSTKQRLVTKSSTEAELVALSDALSQIIWTRHFMAAQGYRQEPAVIYQDNTSTIQLAHHGRSANSRLRHVDIRYFFISDRIKTGECMVNYIPTEQMLADVFTKPLQGEAFARFRARFMVPKTA